MFQADFAKWSKGKNMWEPMLEMQRMNGEAGERMMRECIALCSANAGNLMKNMQTMPRVTRPEDYLTLQLRMMTEQGEQALEAVQSFIKIYQDLLRNYADWVETKMSTAMSDHGTGKSRRSEEH